MSRRTRSNLVFVAAAGLAAASFFGGRMGDVSLREPLALLTLVAMLVSFAVVIVLADPPRRDP